MTPEQNGRADLRDDEAMEAEAAPSDNAMAQELERLRAELEAEQAEKEDLRDKYRRSLADFSNYRKRQDRDRQVQAVRMRMDVLRQLLPILDDFHLAIENAPRSPDESEWVAGVQLVTRKLQALLQMFGAQPMAPLGEPFDPNYHEALLTEPSNEYPEGTVSKVIRDGYMIEGEVLRPAMVQVSTGPGPRR